MDLYTAETVNKEILDKAITKLDETLKKGDWDE